eukprot:m.442480 g.442480  ORF g.442480 m.442480 type:complete len:328 (+) comp18811_c0_seq1:269-1252(+)
MAEPEVGGPAVAVVVETEKSVGEPGGGASPDTRANRFRRLLKSKRHDDGGASNPLPSEGQPVCEPSRTEFTAVGLGTGVIVTTGHGTVFCKIRCGEARGCDDEGEDEYDDDEDWEENAVEENSVSPQQISVNSSGTLHLDLSGVWQSMWWMARVDVQPCDDSCAGPCCMEPKQLDDHCGDDECEGGSCDGTERFSIVSTADSDADSAPSDRSLDEDETEHASDSESTPLSGLGSDQPPLELDPPTQNAAAEEASKPDHSKSPPRERKLAKMWEACKWGRQNKKEPQPATLPADWMDDEDLDEVTVFEARRDKSNKIRAMQSPIVVAS